jgi:hypothetical protein
MNQGYIVVQIFPEGTGPGTPDQYLVIAQFRDAADAVNYAAMKQSLLSQDDTSRITMAQVIY